MLNRIIAWALRNRLLVVVAALVISMMGVVVANDLPIDVLPNLNRPTVTIMTEAHGLVPEDVEQLVTRYIEQSVNGATGVVRVRSSSGLGLSVVLVEFAWDTDIYRNRQIVQEKLQLARSQLPPNVVPAMAPISSIMGQIQIVGIVSKSGKTDPTEIRALVDKTIKLRLLSISGVAQVVSTGGAPRQLQVILDASQMRANDVTLEDAAAAISQANLNASGGFLNVGSKGPLVTVTGLLDTGLELGEAVVKSDPVRPIRIEDIGVVEFGPAAIRTGDAGVMGRRAVVLVIFKQPGVDTVELTNRIDAELINLAKTLPEDLEIMPGIYRQAEFIHRAIDNVTEAVRDGAIFVVIILFIFLLNFRTTAITLTAIPLSIALTALFFKVAGISINTMTLGGLAVAIGALVDDAIVDVENVFRRLKQNKAAGTPRAALAVVFRASSEVRKPVLIGTLVVVSVYMPLFALSGMEGRLFTPIGVAYIVSIAASLLVSLTVTPVLCYYLLPNAGAVNQSKDGFVVRGLKIVTAIAIRFSFRFPLQIATTVGVLVLIALFALSQLGSEFLPPFNEGSAQIGMVLPPGTSLETSDAFGRRLEQMLGEVEGISLFARRTGRAEGDEHAEGVNVSEFIVSFDPDSELTREEVIGDIRARIGREFPGVPTSTEQPLAHLLSWMLSGVAAQVAIKTFGDDLVVLRRVAKQIEAAVRPIPGVADLLVEPQVLVERIEVRPRRAELARYGLTVAEVAETVELALEGAELSRLIQGQYSYPIVIRLRPEDRRDMHSISSLLLEGNSGDLLTLGDVADVRMSLTSNNVNHENVSRRIVVSHNVQGRSLGEVVADVEVAIDEIRRTLPPGYSIRLSGQFEAQEEASRVILILSIVSLLVMFLVLYMHFQSANLAFQVLKNIPAGFLGAVAFVSMTGQTLSIATLVGLVSLAGIASRNGILLIDHYLYLMREEGMPFSKEMILVAGKQRIVPVLMTALTTGIALVPLVMSPGEPGRELLYPVASVIVGGLISTTILDVFLTPGIFWLFGRNAAEKHAARKELGEVEFEQMAASFDAVNTEG